MLISQKWWGQEQNWVMMTFIDVDIYHWMALLWMLYSVTLAYIFKVKHLNVDISIKWWELEQKWVMMTFIDVDIRHWMALLWMLYSVTLTFILKVNKILVKHLLSDCTDSGCPQKICFDLHGAWCGVAHVAHVWSEGSPILPDYSWLN